MNQMIAATAAHAQRVIARVDAGQVDGRTAMAILIADVLGVALELDDDPETSDQLVLMACEWATVRHRSLLADGALRRDPIPDDPGGLDT